MKSIRYHRAGGKAEQLERSHRLRDRIRRQGDAPEGRCISGSRHRRGRRGNAGRCVPHSVVLLPLRCRP